MRIMFQMMNEARLGTGMQGLDAASASFEHAVQYARERIQSKRVEDMANNEAPGVTIINHADIRRSLLWMKSHVEGMRAMNYFIAYCIDMEEVAPNAEEKEIMKGFVEILTPISKAYCSDKGVEICSLGMDVFGGYGYCSEYPMEQYLRDVKIASIYEGTNYIQSLDLVGRKMGQNKGKNLVRLVRTITLEIENCKSTKELKSPAMHLQAALTAFNDLVMQFVTWGKSLDYILPILNARPFLMIMGDLVIGWQLLQAAAIAQKKLAAIYSKKGINSPEEYRTLAQENSEVAFYQGKIANAKYFTANVVPSIEGRCNCIKNADKTPVDMAENSFSI